MLPLPCSQMVVHPPLPLNTRKNPPRFLVPKCPRDRDEKRPIVHYTKILNSLSDHEWKLLKLPSPSTCHNQPNCHLPGLFGSTCDAELSGDQDDVGVQHLPAPVTFPAVAQWCHPECIPGLGGHSVCLF